MPKDYRELQSGDRIELLEDIEAAGGRVYPKGSRLEVGPAGDISVETARAWCRVKAGLSRARPMDDNSHGTIPGTDEARQAREEARARLGALEDARVEVELARTGLKQAAAPNAAGDIDEEAVQQAEQALKTAEKKYNQALRATGKTPAETPETPEKPEGEEKPGEESAAETAETPEIPDERPPSRRGKPRSGTRRS